MKEHGLMFITPLVQAINEDKKIQTRRIMKIQPEYSEGMGKWVLYPKQHPEVYTDLIKVLNYCPYKVGDLIWVKETWAESCDAWGTPVYMYRAGGAVFIGEDNEILGDCDELDMVSIDNFPANGRWKPSIFMPKKAARTWLKITALDFERLQDISEEDAKKEGIFGVSKDSVLTKYTHTTDGKWQDLPRTAKKAFETLWQSINGKESWEANPWVWKIVFEKHTK